MYIGGGAGGRADKRMKREWEDLYVQPTFQNFTDVVVPLFHVLSSLMRRKMAIDEAERRVPYLHYPNLATFVTDDSGKPSVFGCRRLGNLGHHT